MSWITILLFAGAGVLIIALVMILVTQMRSTRHIESLKKKTESPKETQPKPRLKTSHGAQPAGGIRTEPKKRPEPKAAAETKIAADEPETIAPEAKIEVPEPIAEEIPVVIEEEVAVEVAPPVEEAVAETAKAFEPRVYPEFNNARAVEQLGLSQEEADLFIGELVTQIEEELPNLDAALAAKDLEKLEKVSHMLKGSATSLGEGGVADILVELNTYCKDGSDMEVIEEHLKNLHYYFAKLKEKFGN